MKKISLRNFSFLGLFLMGASAVTAAIMPSKTNTNDNAFAAGSLIDSSGGGGLTVSAGGNAGYSYTVTGVSGTGVTGTNTIGVGLNTAGGTSAFGS